MWFDTHAHLYVSQFDQDRKATVERAIAVGVEKIALPNIDLTSLDDLFALCDVFPKTCMPMVGLHPCSVKEDYKAQLEKLEARLNERPICAIGEIGLDLYWDTTYKLQQEEALRIQCAWAQKMRLPIVIHSRESIDRNIEILTELELTVPGVFHCFTGSISQAQKIIELGFLLGIGGVLTFKNSNLDEVLKEVDLEHIILETDAPYLAPVPFRGKRNESAYILEVGSKLADVKNVPLELVAKITSENAKQLYSSIL
jgi:TatD DNase family protein